MRIQSCRLAMASDDENEESYAGKSTWLFLTSFFHFASICPVFNNAVCVRMCVFVCVCASE